MLRRIDRHIRPSGELILKACHIHLVGTGSVQPGNMPSQSFLVSSSHLIHSHLRPPLSSEVEGLGAGITNESLFGILVRTNTDSSLAQPGVVLKSKALTIKMHVTQFSHGQLDELLSSFLRLP